MGNSKFEPRNANDRAREARTGSLPNAHHPGRRVARSIPFGFRVSDFGFLLWQFGPCLQRFSPAQAWSILGLAAIAGLLLIVFLYRRTLRRLPPGSRNALTVLRVLLLLTLCFLLANPSRVRLPANPHKAPERRLAVIVDRSASMDAVDNRNETRLRNALRTWKLHTDEAGKCFDRVDDYRFASRLEKVPTLDDAVRAGPPGAETKLWSALNDAMAESPAAIVCLTDGLDTSGKDAAEVIAQAQSHGIPLYFVPARNRSRPVDLLCIRDVKTPSKVLRLSKFNASAILEISTPHDRTVPVELWSGSRKVASATLPARAGWNVLPWSPEVSAGEPGPMPLEFRLGEGAARETAASTTQVVEHTSVRILYYQGALQWGYRFLRGALESDPSFRLTNILNPALGVRITSEEHALVDLPDNLDDLKKFQIVILAHVLADQLSTKQQQALIDYAKGGGGVLFIAPDSEATDRFAGTLIEQMLPVVFERSTETEQQKQARAFEARMRSEFEPTDESEETREGGAGSEETPHLLPFQIPPGATSVLKKGEPVPMFSNYARVLCAKPAAEILAVHPSERTPDNAPRILLARQRFGAGFSVAMATDLLWRWKMSLPSDSHAAETFWQQLMLSLVPASGEGLRIVKAGGGAAVNRSTGVLVTGSPGEDPPRITAISPSGANQALVPELSPAGWQAAFTPNVQGRWQLTATDSAGNQAAISLPVEAEILTAENSNAPPDMEGMRHIAEATGGALIDSNPVFTPEPESQPAASGEKTLEPLWNQSWLLGLLLGLYAAELIVRRVFRLL
jgi:hypothetical protein